jgi:RHS repeat-associated protein
MRYVPGMEEPLVATGPVTEQENADLDAALAAFHDAPARAGLAGDYDDYAKPLLAFVSAHPQSNWNAALYTNIGFGYYRAGYYSRTFTYLDKAWQLGRNATTPQARLMVDRAVGELAGMHARVGHAQELEALFSDIGNRPIGGPATELIQGAHEGLWAFHHRPEIAYLCGPNALRNLLLALKASPEQIKIAKDARSGSHGFSLMQLAALADMTNLKYTLIHREAGQPIPVPSIVHWNVNHYAAIVGIQDGLYRVKDPTFGVGNGDGLLTARAIDAEGSGYFLVPAEITPSNINNNWRTVAARSVEASEVYGMGDTGSNDPQNTRNVDPTLHHCNGDTPQVTPPVCTDAPQPQMTIADAHDMLVSLNLTDTPVGYKPQVGPSAKTTLVYNQREAMQAANMSFSNVGPKWTFSWLSYIQDDPNNPGSKVQSYASGGGGYFYINYSGGTFHVDTYDSSQLLRIPPTGPATSYERLLPDGGKEVYSLSNGATTYPRLMFLTQVVDAAGNSATLEYDKKFRLTAVTDAMGRKTTFHYSLSNAQFLVTTITDPFGRTSHLVYDGSGRLSSITDPIGITSIFTYGSPTETNFITALTTPYGTSTFSDTPPTKDTSETNTRPLTLTDPLGYTEFLYFYEKANLIPDSDPPATVPSGVMNTFNQYLEWRNTYYFDKHAFAFPNAITKNPDGSIATEDVTKSHITHWVHDETNTNLTGRTPESIKQPLEHRVWYNYPFQPNSLESGNLDRPTASGRVLDDGTAQLSTATYNEPNPPYGNFGLPLSITDPSKRTTKYAYAANNIDLLTVQQLTASPSTYTTLATFGDYNGQHEPQTYTGADGQVWRYSYNTAGQLSTITDPNNGVTTYNYDSLGRLSTVQNANLQTALTLTYDSVDRVQTRTDSEGYTLTYEYDKLDRVTKITYPDGTTDQYHYTFQGGPLAGKPSLELRKHIDRLGRVTKYDYDADRRLIQVSEPGAITTRYDYYEDGTLKDITDAKGNVTHWEIDLQSRPMSKTYAFGTANAQTETYTYETTNSRLHSVTDTLGQVKTFTYGHDDRIIGFAYTNTVNPTPNVTLAWDPFFPRLSSMADGLGSTTYAYTPIGSLGALKLASIDGPFNNDVIGLTYDQLGRLAGRNITGGNETFGYDPISRLTSHGTPLGGFTYGYLGQTDQTTSRSVTNGATTVSTGWGYDTNVNDRRLISIVNSGVTRSYTLGYLNGTTTNPYDIMSISDTAAAGHPFASQSHSYGYDSIDRLLSATATVPGNNTYVYDKLDNATTVTTPSGTVKAQYNDLNQLDKWGTKTYTYDANGNTLSGDETKTYKWDAENRLVEIDYVGSAAKTNFAYDGMGRRAVDVETAEGGTTTTSRSLWCGSAICQTRDGSDNMSRRDMDEGEFNVATGQKLVYMPDQLGSARDLVDGTTGALIDAFDYTPYGSVARTFGSTLTDYGYAGLFSHPASGLNLSMTRPMDGITGRWFGRDPVREAGGANLYDYVSARPLNRIDPYGLFDIFGFGGAGAHAPAPLSPAGEGLYLGGYNSSAGLYGGNVLAGGVALELGPVEASASRGRESVTTLGGDTHCEGITLYEIGGGPGIPILGHAHGGFGKYILDSGETGWFFFLSGGFLGSNGFVGFGGTLASPPPPCVLCT